MSRKQAVEKGLMQAIVILSPPEAGEESRSFGQFEPFALKGNLVFQRLRIR